MMRIYDMMPGPTGRRLHLVHETRRNPEDARLPWGEQRVEFRSVCNNIGAWWPYDHEATVNAENPAETEKRPICKHCVNDMEREVRRIEIQLGLVLRYQKIVSSR